MKTIEEAAEKKYPLKGELEIHFYMVRRLAFIDGAKWQQERSYSEEELKLSFIEGHNICRCVTDNTDEAKECFKEWFEQFKKN